MKSKYVNKKEDLFAFFSLNKDNRINFFSVESIFTHYFLFITSSALFLFFFNRGTIFNAGFPLLIGTMFFITRNRVNKNSIDILWYLCLFWIGFTWIINDYPNKLPLIINCILTQICYMFAYWIGRCSSKNYIQEIIKKSYFPLLLVCSIGIYLYISPVSYTHLTLPTNSRV